VCSVSTDDLASPAFFRSWESANPAFKLQTTIIEAARATSAAPTFFQSIDIVGDAGYLQSFIDGGVRVNNPVRCVLNEARTFSPTSEIDYILSLGTGARSAIRIGAEYNIFKRLLLTRIRLARALIKITTNCDTIANEVSLEYANQPGVYYRLNVDRGLENVSLSEWTKMDDVWLRTVQYIQQLEVWHILAPLMGKLHH